MNMSAEQNVNGFGYGVGVKHLLYKHVYVGLEVQKVDYSSATYKKAYENREDVYTVKPKQLQGLISVGYKF